MRYDLDLLNRLYERYERRVLNSSSLATRVALKLNKEQFPEYFENRLEYDEEIKRLIAFYLLIIFK